MDQLDDILKILPSDDEDSNPLEAIPPELKEAEEKLSSTPSPPPQPTPPPSPSISQSPAPSISQSPAPSPSISQSPAPSPQPPATPPPAFVGTVATEELKGEEWLIYGAVGNDTRLLGVICDAKTKQPLSFKVPRPKEYAAASRVIAQAVFQTLQEDVLQACAKGWVFSDQRTILIVGMSSSLWKKLPQPHAWTRQFTVPEELKGDPFLSSLQTRVNRDLTWLQATAGATVAGGAALLLALYKLYQMRKKTVESRQPRHQNAD